MGDHDTRISKSWFVRLAHNNRVQETFYAVHSEAREFLLDITTHG